MLLGLMVLVGWHAHIRAAVQIFDGLDSHAIQHRFVLPGAGAAGIGLSTRRRLLLLAGGSFAALMGAAVILEYATGHLVRDRHAVLLPVGTYACLPTPGGWR